MKIKIKKGVVQSGSEPERIITYIIAEKNPVAVRKPVIEFRINVIEVVGQLRVIPVGFIQ